MRAKYLSHICGCKPENPHLRAKSSLWASQLSYMASVGGYPTEGIKFGCFRFYVGHNCGCKPVKWAKPSNIFYPGGQKSLKPHLWAESLLWRDKNFINGECGWVPNKNN